MFSNLHEDICGPMVTIAESVSIMLNSSVMTIQALFDKSLALTHVSNAMKKATGSRSTVSGPI